ncbi:MAG: FGGY-family carbohydrate kinase [Prochlorococcaceae cyanobacterium]
MAQGTLALGVDLGSSGLRLALVNREGSRVAEVGSDYPAPLVQPQGWRNGLVTLCHELSADLRSRVGALALAGTSGTLLLCRGDGSLPAGIQRGVNLAEALPYHLACPEQARAAAAIAAGGAASSASGSLARALRLLEAAQELAPAEPWLLRHQADWLMGWLLGDWRWGEEGNNLRLGWDLQGRSWAGEIAAQPWSSALPAIRASGEVLGQLTATAAAALGLSPGCRVVAGSTDANAAVLAAEPGDHDGVSVLGTTLVLKQWCAEPIGGPGVSCHRVAGRWLVGGASNAGGGVLRRFFSDRQLAELSSQIDPAADSGLLLRPLNGRGERFPVDDPDLEPVLDPRPVSDGLFLQGLLEGLAEIERAGWTRLRQLGAPAVQRVISLGGGARNPQWRAIRQRRLGCPVLNRPRLSAALGMARLAATSLPKR